MNNDRSAEIDTPVAPEKPTSPLQRKPFGRRVLRQKLRAAKAEAKLLGDMIEMDEKTGIYNIRGFERRLREAISAQKRDIERAPLAVMYLDLNSLKEINDTQGHLMGDAKIEYVAEVLSTSIRDIDTAARLTRGDEFGILLPGTTIEGAKELWSRLDQEFIDRGVWISAGCTTVNIDGPRASLSEAERLMYDAKAAAKDQSGPNFGKNVLFTPGQENGSLVR